MQDIKCPMCGSTRLIADSERPAAELSAAYRARFGVETNRFFSAPLVTTYRCASCDLRSHFGGLPGDSEFYDQMQVHPFYYERDKPEFDYAVGKLIELQPQRVLEVGCGEGNFLRKIMAAFSVRGSELSEKSISKLRAVGVELDRPDDNYDFVCTFQVLEHVADVDSFVRGMLGKLLPGGYLLITVPNRDSKYVSEGTSSALDFPPHHMTQWSKRALQGLASRYGLSWIDYYEEAMRPTHLAGLMATRRAQIPAGKNSKRGGKLLGRLFDLVFIPYHLDRVAYAGHTHGVLLRRPL